MSGSFTESQTLKLCCSQTIRLLYLNNVIYVLDLTTISGCLKKKENVFALDFKIVSKDAQNM